jgi:hypothetical protein
MSVGHVRESGGLAIRRAVLSVILALAAVAGVPSTSGAEEAGPDPLPPGKSCTTFDGIVCQFECVAGAKYFVDGSNGSPFHDYDGYAKCGDATITCHANFGSVGCASPGVGISAVNAVGECWAYNDWGPTEITTCWSSGVMAMFYVEEPPIRR